LRRLAKQIKAKKVVVKLFLRYPLHAKLYLLFRPDPESPIVSHLGSSNLTLAGLAGKGELSLGRTADAAHFLPFKEEMSCVPFFGPRKWPIPTVESWSFTSRAGHVAQRFNSRVRI
jgi:hypothetical protein